MIEIGLGLGLFAAAVTILGFSFESNKCCNKCSSYPGSCACIPTDKENK